jgi:PleD family two-component response regulator
MPETDDDLTAAIKAADEALYNAKATGRNRVAQSEIP